MPTPALNPLRPLLAQPYARLVQEGHICEISAVFSPFGCTVKGKAGPTLVGKDGLAEGQEYPLGTLLASATKHHVGERVRGKTSKAQASKEPALPAKSLCDRDFAEGKEGELSVRAEAVAEAAKGGALVGRVRAAGKFLATQTLTFQQWWALAPGEDRLFALTEARYRKNLPPGAAASVGQLRCPFRGDAVFRVSEEIAED